MVAIIGMIYCIWVYVSRDAPAVQVSMLLPSSFIENFVRSDLCYSKYRLTFDSLFLQIYLRNSLDVEALKSVKGQTYFCEEQI